MDKLLDKHHENMKKIIKEKMIEQQKHTAKEIIEILDKERRRLLMEDNYFSNEYPFFIDLIKKRYGIE